MAFGKAKKSGEAPETLWRQFLLDSLSDMIASASTHPIDLIKVRIQIAGANKDGMFATGLKRV